MSGEFLDTAEHADHFPDLVTIEQETGGTPNARGAVSGKTWVAVVGLVELPGLLYGHDGEEVQGIDGATVICRQTLLLQDYYPAITEKMRAVIGSDRYNIILANHEGMKTVSVLKVKQVKG